MSPRRALRRAAALSVVLGSCLGLSSAASANYVHPLEGSFAVGPPEASALLLSVGVDSSGGANAGSVYVGGVSLFSEESFVARFDEGGALLDEIDGSETPAGFFRFLSFEDNFQDSGIAVDSSAGPSKGDVYVADVANKVIDRFDESGAYVCQITGSATPSSSECNGPAGSETAAGDMLPAGLAVDDASGILYVADAKNDAILKFGPAGAYLGQISSPHVTAPNSIAVDSTGAIYVANSGPLFQETPGNLVKLSAAGELLYVVDEEDPIRVAVDRSSDDVYVAEHLFEGSQVSQFDATGDQVSAFGGGDELLAPAVAVDEVSQRVYVSKSILFSSESSRVLFYGPGLIIPDAALAAPSDVGETTVTLNGSVDPDGGGDVTDCQFEFVAASAYDESAPNPYAAGPPPVACSEPLPYDTPTAVSVALSGLFPSTTYRFRIRAANANGLFSFSEDGTFDTAGPPTIEEQSTSDIERHAAVLRARINPRGFGTQYRFEYVDDEHFQAEGGFSSPATRSTPLSEIGEGLKPLSVSQGIGGLLVGTTYHFRAVAVNARGTVEGPGQTFATVPIATIDRQWAYARGRSASVEAEIDPLGLETGCHVQYVSDPEFQLSGFANAATKPCLASLGSGSGEVVARAELVDLERGADYRFRFIATNSSGSLPAPDRSFATFGIESFSYEVLDKEGNPYTQAGGHPYMSVTHYDYNHTLVPSRNGTMGSLTGFIKDVLTELPPGRVGGTVVPPRCPGFVADEEKCSGDTQVGTITIEYFESSGARATRTRGLFNVFAPRGTAGRYSSIDPYVASDASIRSEGDYGATAGAFDITEEARIVGVTAKIWGVPSDPGHDSERRCPNGASPCVSNAPKLPLLRNPTTCSGDPLTTHARVSTWEAPNDFAEASALTPPITGCDQLEFEPTVKVQPTTDLADSPSGLHVEIHVPQNQDPAKLDPPDLRHAVFNLPAGLAINPATANGMLGCAPGQVDLHGANPANCPNASEVGSVEIDTPLLDHPLHGGIYVATPYDNPFDSLFAIYIAVADPETGVTIKLAGKIEVDPETGQLTTSLSDNPQLPFEDFTLDFFGGPQALLRTPATCGTYTTRATLTPWSAPHSGPPAEPSDSYRIVAGAGGRGCPPDLAQAPNRPAFRAGTISPRAGAYSPFVLQLEREDGTQEIAALDVAPPPGLTGRIAARGSCPEAALAAAERKTGAEELAAPSCALSTLLGSVNIGAGSGPAPVHVPGKTYLAGPYKGAPLSIAVVVPMMAGPFDLGTTVVRAALLVDLQTGQIRIQTDRLPAMSAGILLNVRSISVRLDGPEFTLNPTSCEPMAVQGQATSVFGQAAALTDPFRVGGCRRLGFAPRLGLRLFGKTHRGSHPKLRAVLRMPRRGANISRVGVTLPPSQFLDNEHIRNICTKEQFAAESCPADSVYGYARAWTPLLDNPLEGPVYLRSSDHRLPDLIARLNGQVRFELSARIGSSRGRIRANVEGLPDVPVTKFVLTMEGGGKGLLQNGAGICDTPQRSAVEFEGQNGRVRNLQVQVRPQCGNRAQPRRR